MSLAIRTRKQSFVRWQEKKHLLQSHGICFRVPLALVFGVLLHSISITDMTKLSEHRVWEICVDNHCFQNITVYTTCIHKKGIKRKFEISNKKKSNFIR